MFAVSNHTTALLGGGPLNVDYEFVEMHFHWGQTDQGRQCHLGGEVGVRWSMDPTSINITRCQFLCEGGDGVSGPGSEHSIDGHKYPMELHMVHRNIHDETVDEALEHENGLTVLAFKFQVGVLIRSLLSKNYPRLFKTTTLNPTLVWTLWQKLWKTF